MNVKLILLHTKERTFLSALLHGGFHRLVVRHPGTDR
jgi:hypothetical protein